MSGVFVTFEGGDGSGKTTQIQLLKKWLEDHGHTVVVTREPGGTDLGNELREIILHRKGFIAPRAEALLYAADRAHHIHTLVKPALERGEVVVQDRYLDSSLAYQGAGRVLDPNEVREVSLWATENLMPVLTVLLDVPADVAKKRQNALERAYDRLEAEAEDFHQRVRTSYQALADAEPERFLVIDGTLAIEAIHDQIIQKVSHLLS
ncbi:MAG: thymidylate kinase [Microbacteriaceae bacterium BACL25 MAG-120322-bin65]|nr:MAG: thymidylate kinase [Microbacteriaceae bacterium BACL25 MAG-120322-bin65]HAA79645.1 dTMP kinase [Microbacteriaceae bacterium]